jgi:hypothetical protein
MVSVQRGILSFQLTEFVPTLTARVLARKRSDVCTKTDALAVILPCFLKRLSRTELSDEQCDVVPSVIQISLPVVFCSSQ